MMKFIFDSDRKFYEIFVSFGVEAHQNLKKTIWIAIEGKGL